MAQIEPRDYFPFLRAADTERPADSQSMRSLMALLPTAPPAATLWTQGGMLIASALLPLGLWLLGRFDSIQVLLLYFAEGAVYSLAVTARVLFTAAQPPSGEASRVLTALRYLLWHTAVWSGLILLTLALVAPKLGGIPFPTWLVGFAARFKESGMWLSALVTGSFITQDVVRRSDYLDARLEKGPREIARYGYSYPWGLGLLLFPAIALHLSAVGFEPKQGIAIISGAFLALWLIAWRTVLQLSGLLLPLWGRAIPSAMDEVTALVEEEMASKEGRRH